MSTNRTFLTGTLPLKAVGAVLNLAAILSLTHLLGETGFSVYAFALAWVQILSLLCLLGLDRVIVRELGESRGESRRDTLSLWMKSAGLGLGAAVFVSSTLGVIITHLELFQPKQARSLLMGLPLLSALTVLALVRAGYQGSGYAVRSHVWENLLCPALWLGGIGLWVSVHADPGMAILIQGITFSVGTVIGVMLLTHHLRSGSTAASPPRVATWLKTAPIFIALGGLAIINTRSDQILLGTIGDPTDVGPFAVAVRLTEGIGLILAAGNAALTPRIAELWPKRDRPALQAAVTTITRSAFLLTTPAAIVLAAGGYFWLRLFGEGFTDAWAALSILAAAAVFNAWAGPVIYLLVLTGHERVVAIVLAITTSANIVADLVFVPLFGMTGAALSTAAAIVAWNIATLFVVRKKLGIACYAKFQTHLVNKCRNQNSS